MGVLCVLAGIFTAWNAGFEPGRIEGFYGGVLPFCIILALVTIPQLTRATIAIAGCLLSWRIAFYVMAWMDRMMSTENSADPGLLARAGYWFAPGLVGALCVAISISIGVPRLRNIRGLFGTALLGGLTAISFAGGRSAWMYVGFPLWQAAIGIQCKALADLDQRSRQPK